VIGLLRGVVRSKQPPGLVVEVAGVGYELEAPMSTFYQLPESGSEVELYTHLALREESLSLYGFATEMERRLFRSLIRVSGVGPRLGLTILSGMSAEGFMRSVQDSDTAALARLPGVGKKTAERLVIEMRDRLAEESTVAPAAEPAGAAARPPGAIEEAVSALVALGYKSAEATRMVDRVDADGASAEEIIRLALRGTASGGSGA